MRLPDDLVEELERSKSDTIERIRRVRYLFGGQIDDDNGPLELTFSSGHVLLVDSAPNGSTLAVRGTTWKDPFESPLSPENQEWVRTHGKWEVFDVSDEGEFASFVGQSIVLIKSKTDAGRTVVLPLMVMRNTGTGAFPDGGSAAANALASAISGALRSRGGAAS